MASTPVLSTNATNKTLSIYVPSHLYHDELMKIYLWPLVLVCLYTILGTVGNAVTIYIYTFKWAKTKTRIYILSLGLINFVNSIFNMPIEAYILGNPLQFDQHILCKITRGLTFILNNSCACVFVTIAIDRVLLVYRPITRTILTESYARNGCLISVLIGCCTGWPGFVFYGTATLPEKLDSGVIARGKTCYIADAYLRHLTWPSNFNKILFSLMLFVFVLLLVMYIIVGKKIYQVTKTSDVHSKPKTSFTKGFLVLKAVQRFTGRKNSLEIDETVHSSTEPGDAGSQIVCRETDSPKNDRTRSVSFANVVGKLQHKPELHENVEKLPNAQERRESSVKPQMSCKMSRRISTTNAGAWRDNTISMTLITVAFVACYLPYLIIVSLRYVDSDLYSQLDINRKIAYHVFLRTYFLNSAVNPFIYSFVNCEFRRTFSEMVTSFFKKFKKRSAAV